MYDNIFSKKSENFFARESKTPPQTAAGFFTAHS